VYDLNSIKCTKNFLCICEILIRIRCLLSTVVPAHVVTIIKKSLLPDMTLFRMFLDVRGSSREKYTVKLVLRGHRWDKEKVALFHIKFSRTRQEKDDLLRRVGGIISYLRVYLWTLRLYHPEALLYSLRQSRRLYSGAEGWYNLNAHGLRHMFYQ
jgi:hypothetical protein